MIAHGDCIRTFTQRGVADLYDLLVTEPDFLQGASIADKVIGKAAASLITSSTATVPDGVRWSKPAVTSNRPKKFSQL